MIFLIEFSLNICIARATSKAKKSIGLGSFSTTFPLRLITVIVYFMLEPTRYCIGIFWNVEHDLLFSDQLFACLLEGFLFRVCSLQECTFIRDDFPASHSYHLSKFKYKIAMEYYFRYGKRICVSDFSHLLNYWFEV